MEDKQKMLALDDDLDLLQEHLKHQKLSVSPNKKKDPFAALKAKTKKVRNTPIHPRPTHSLFKKYPLPKFYRKKSPQPRLNK